MAATSETLRKGNIPQTIRNLTGVGEIWMPRQAKMSEGDIFFSICGGGGSNGDPIERDPDKVARDVEEGHGITGTGKDTVWVVDRSCYIQRRST